MLQPIIILILLTILFLSLLKIKSLKQEIKATAKEFADDQKEFSHLLQYNDKLKEIKKQKKAKILELFSAHSKVSNKIVSQSIGVASATAFRYLDELEKEGQIVQKGYLGKTVYYSKIN